MGVLDVRTAELHDTGGERRRTSTAPAICAGLAGIGFCRSGICFFLYLSGDRDQAGYFPDHVPDRGVIIAVLLVQARNHGAVRLTSGVSHDRYGGGGYCGRWRYEPSR